MKTSSLFPVYWINHNTGFIKIHFKKSFFIKKCVKNSMVINWLIDDYVLFFDDVDEDDDDDNKMWRNFDTTNKTASFNFPIGRTNMSSTESVIYCIGYISYFSPCASFFKYLSVFSYFGNCLSRLTTTYCAYHHLTSS